MSYKDIEYIDIFVEETIENTQQLDILLIKLEKDKSNKGILKSVYQAVHTVKGSCASMKFTEAASLMHSVETLLDFMIKDRLPLNDEIVEKLFNINDIIKVIVTDIQNDREFQTGFSDEKLAVEYLYDKLEVNDDTPGKGAGNEEKLKNYRFDYKKYKEKILQAKEAGVKVYIITFFIGKDEELKDSRRRILFRRLSAFGEFLDYVPRRKSDFFAGDEIFVKSLFAGNVDDELLYQVDKTDRIKNFSYDEVPFDKIKFEEKEPPARKEFLFEENTIKVKIDKLDKLLNQAQELTIINLAFQNILTEMTKEKQFDNIRYVFSEARDKLSKLSHGLHRQIMQTRMVPVGYLFKRYYRLVRDLAGTLKKKVALTVTGEEEEIDKNTIDLLYEPLLHLVRNILDHGIEGPVEREKAGKDPQAKIEINAYRKYNRLYIQISDDGRGIDTETVRKKAIDIGAVSYDQKLTREEILELIFLPNFSTKAEVDELGGRGMGMNIVRERIDMLYGHISLETGENSGTIFTISLPTTLTILPALIISEMGERYAIPFTDIDEVIKVEPSEVKFVDQNPVWCRDELIPLIRLRDFFKGKVSGIGEEKLTVLIIDTEEKRFGLVVDCIFNKYDIVTKNIDYSFLNIPGIKSVTILGDGKVVPIIDVSSIAGKFSKNMNVNPESNSESGKEIKMEGAYEII